MIKMIFAGVWAAAVLSGSVWFFGQAVPPPSDEEMDEFFGLLETIKLETIVVPIVRSSAVQGYLILDSAYTVNTEVASSLTVPIEFVLRDIINGSIYGNADIDIYRLERFDLEKFQKRVVEDINVKLGKRVVHSVMIQRLDFMTKEEIRDQQLRRS